ncbi:MAG: ribose-phosphate pyrophosphokinase-like domain-containing protein, partial [Eggerthellaceae bacterium]|nr:ribose-phosphate pyrophosphokinase-like domain-containing protein [Eggerthellaceae bacterium]
MTEMHKTLAVFAGSVNPSLADGIAETLGIALGNVKLEKFANGEIYARYMETVRGSDVFLVQSVCSGNGFDVN